MSNSNPTFFQYCPKFVIFDLEFSRVLLCERKGEADFDKTYSYAGGKVETLDNDIWKGMQREKKEELGKDCQIKLFKNFCAYAYYVKKDGSHMILPHHLCIFLGGTINLSEEYSDYKWVNIEDLENCGLSMIPNIVTTAKKMKSFSDQGVLALSESIIL